MASEIGRLFISLEGALTEACPNRDEREELAKYIRQSIKQNVRHAHKRRDLNLNSGR